jgi:glycosyltransferase involved in cell wall biosynthesis
MKVITNQENWIIKRLAYELRKIPQNMPITYFMTYAMLDEKTEGMTAALFTHYEKGNHKRFVNAAKKVDIAIALSENTAKEVRKYRKQCEVIHCGTDLKREIIFGVVGRVYKSGRKGEHLIAQLCNDYKIIALGEDWPCENVDIERELFYPMIDYLIVSSTIEGGPIPVLDAIAMGVPVIAPDVGWSWDYPVIRYEKGSVDSLRSVLERLTKVRTWNDWLIDHERLFIKFTNNV